MSEVDYDIIIVGGGIAGLGAGSILSANGFSVLLVEKSELLGGRCQSYEKEGFIIDTNFHAFEKSNKGAHGEICRLSNVEPMPFDYFKGRKSPELNYLDKKHLKWPDGIATVVPMGEFPNFMKMVGIIYKATEKELAEFDKITVKDWVDRHTTNKQIHTIFSFLTNMSFAYEYQDIACGEMFRVVRSLFDATLLKGTRWFGYPIGGCQAIPEYYAKIIKSNNGAIMNGPEYEVKKIIIEDNIAKGIELKNGKTFSAKIIISNAGVKITTQKLIGEKYFPKDYVENVKNIIPSYSAAAIKVALKTKLTKQKCITWVSTEEPIEYWNQIKKGKIPEYVDLFGTVPSNSDPNLAPKGKQLIVIGTLTPLNLNQDFKKWGESIYNSLLTFMPEVESNLEWYDVSSPMTINKMVGNEGKGIKAAQIPGQIGESRFSFKTPIKNLFYAGDETGTGGVGTELAGNSALKIAKYILKTYVKKELVV
ncbi:MAG: phytoene desaturase family protein [Candidatus Helarchaeota archaeon]